MKKSMSVLSAVFLGMALAMPSFADQSETKNVEILSDADKAEAHSMVRLQYCFQSGMKMMAPLMLLAPKDEKLKNDLEKAIISLQAECEESTGYTLKKGLAFQQHLVDLYGSREHALSVLSNTLNGPQ